MSKFIRSLTVIGASAALTFAGAGVATAQTSISDLERLSSRFLDPVVDIEGRLYDAGKRFGDRSTGKSRPTLNNLAKSANLTDPQWKYEAPGVEKKYYGYPENYDLFRVPEGQYQTLINFLDSQNYTGYHNGKNYGVHASTSGGYHYVATVFKP